MKRVEFKRKGDGKPLYAWLELVSAWTESPDDKTGRYTQITVGGHKWIVDETLDQVDRKLRGMT